ncbi:MAG: response regulator, partial [Oligoflexia bacterium]|nr:response regulator [Oligoflexia bacterium]
AKFTQKGSIKLEVNLLKIIDNQSFIEFVIKDSGKGIGPAYLNKIFTPFTQEDSSINRKYGGTGLGMSIVKKLTELMNGSIKIESTEGQGTTVTVVLPLEHSKQTQLHIDTTNYKKLAGKLVMALDDNENSLEMLRKFCYRSKMECLTFSKPLLLLECLTNKTAIPDVFFLDLTLSDMDGNQLLEEIKTKATYKDIPAIAMASNAFKAATKIARENHFSAFMPKPLFKDNFLKITYNVLFNTRPDNRPQELPLHTTPTKSLGKRILVAEDNIFNQALIKKQLTNLDHLFEVVNSGAEVIEILKKRPSSFDLILMDLQMPNVDGLEATKWIRGAGIKIPIIGLSAHALKQYEEEAIKIGMNDYLTKPCNTIDLKNKLNKYLKAPSSHTIPSTAKEEINQEIYDLFLETTNEKLQAFPSYLQGKDFKNLQFLGHNLKGNAKQVGHAELARIGEEIEKKAKDKDLETLHTLYQELYDYFIKHNLLISKFQLDSTKSV